MSEEQPVPSLCQTPELSLHLEHVLRMGLGLVLGDVAVALQRLKLPGCRLRLLPQVQWSLASMCQSSVLISSAPHPCCNSWSAVCFLLPGDFGDLSPSSSSLVGTSHLPEHLCHTVAKKSWGASPLHLHPGLEHPSQGSQGLTQECKGLLHLPPKCACLIFSG